MAIPRDPLGGEENISGLGDKLGGAPRETWLNPADCGAFLHLQCSASTSFRIWGAFASSDGTWPAVVAVAGRLLMQILHHDVSGQQCGSQQRTATAAH